MKRVADGGGGWTPQSETGKRPRMHGGNDTGLMPIGNPLGGEFLQWMNLARVAVQRDFPQLSEGSEVEVELRFGLLVNRGGCRAFPSIPGSQAHVVTREERTAKGLTFQSGVSERDFRKYRQGAEKLAKEEPVVKRRTTAFVYGDGLRINQDAQGVITKEEKQRVAVIGHDNTLDVAMPSCPYDLRIGITVETPAEHSGGVPETWSQRRMKNRTSMHKPGTVWQMDLTTVTTEVQENGQRRMSGTYEVEIELQQAGISMFLNPDTTAKATEELSQLVETLMPRDSQSTELDPVSDSAVSYAVAAVCSGVGAQMRDSSGQKVSPDGFPGAQPVSMRRGHIRQVIQRSPAEFWVAEKTDGVRYLLVVVEVAGATRAVFVDRKMACFTREGIDVFARCFPKGTVLDGEIVQNRSWNQLVFMMFDILQWGDQCLVNGKFEQRYNFINQTVNLAYAKAVGQVKPPLPLVRKKWFKTTQITEVLSKIVVEEDGAECYVDIPSRHHKSDGLILVPDRYYAKGTDFGLLKFKERSTMTLDFQVAWAQNSLGINVWFDGPAHQTIDFTNQINLPVHDRYRLFADLGQLQSAVCEFAFNEEVGKWEYKLIRHDKHKSNYFITILDTIAGLSENVTTDELEFKLPCRSLQEADEWETLVKQALRDIVQRKKIMKGHGR